MIITDGVHLVSDSSAAELHKFAEHLGLKRRWLQRRKRIPHYDLTTERALARALALGAERVNSKELLNRAKFN